MAERLQTNETLLYFRDPCSAVIRPSASLILRAALMKSALLLFLKIFCPMDWQLDLHLLLFFLALSHLFAHFEHSNTSSREQKFWLGGLFWG